MRVVHHDSTTGRYRLRLDTPSDLWRVARLIHPGEVVGGSTTRRDPEAPLDTPEAQKQRRRIWLSIRAEQVEFHGFSGHVRVTGPIVEGPFDQGRHHTLDLDVGDELTVDKPSPSVADRVLVDEGVAAKGDPMAVVAAVDWGDSSIVRIRGRAIETIADVRRSVGGKQFAGGEKTRQAYVDELLSLLEPELDRAAVTIVAGPGFLKEELSKRLLERRPDAKAKVKLFATAESGRVGIDELLRSGRAAGALTGAVAAEEARVVESLVQALAGLRAAVGPGEVTEAVQGGAVETLIVGDRHLTDSPTVRLLDASRDARASVVIVQSDGDAGKRLEAVGGVGAILRFDWRPASRPVRAN